MLGTVASLVRPPAVWIRVPAASRGRLRRLVAGRRVVDRQGGQPVPQQRDEILRGTQHHGLLPRRVADQHAQSQVAVRRAPGADHQDDPGRRGHSWDRRPRASPVRPPVRRGSRPGAWLESRRRCQPGPPESDVSEIDLVSLIRDSEGRTTVERTPVRIRVLGGFALAVHGQAVPLPVQAQRLVVLLAVRDRTPRVVAAGLLWGDVLQTRALSNLRNAVWRLNGASAEILEGGRDVVALRPGVSTDLDDARRLGRDVAAGVPPAGVSAALDLLDHDLMPSWDEDWLLMERERQRQVRLHAAEALSQALRAQGRHAEAVQAALTAVRAEPMRESAQRVLIEAHLAEGNVSEALRQAAGYRALLAEELGLAAGAEFEALLAGQLHARSQVPR